MPFKGIFILFIFFSSYLASAKSKNSQHHGNYPKHIENIEVLGEQNQNSELLELVPSVSFLTGEELFVKSQKSLGETLRNEPGVNSTQFGPNASRPVIRGLEGDRIRILQNGLGVLDASSTSQDHAVPFSPMSVDSIEIVRGPMSLLYGSSAVGGVVNVVTSRIHKHYDSGFYGGIDLKSESVDSSQSAAGKIDYGWNGLMIHLDGDYAKSNNLNVPTTPSKIPNSASEQHSLAGGITYFTSKDDSYGISYSTSKNNYGVIKQEEGQDVRIHLEQKRVDFVAQWWFDNFLESILLRSAQSFYTHSEFEGDELGTTFDTHGNETRLEFIQSRQGPLEGVFGLQLNSFNFSALGDEAFLPETKNLNIAAFIFEELSFDYIKYNLGFRYEQNQSKAIAGNLLTSEQKKKFDTLSLSLGMLYKFNSVFSTGLNTSYNERAPNFQELYANGAHVATSTFERGNQSLELEKTLALEWSLRMQKKSSQAALTFFTHRINDFISLNPAGTFHDTDDSGTPGDSLEDFPIYDYLAVDAEFYGAEFEFTQEIQTFLPGSSRIKITADYLKARQRTSGNSLPRISPSRQGIELQHDIAWFGTFLQFMNVSKQKDVAINESPTKGYSLMNLGFSFDFKIASSPWTAFTTINNIFDKEARNHVSILKDSAPLPGRNLAIGLRGYF